MTEPGEVSKGFFARIGSVFGIGRNDTRAIDTTLGEGFKNGTATFTPESGEDGVYGTVHTNTTDAQGRVVPTEKPITNSDEAAYLAGLQGQAQKKK